MSNSLPQEDVRFQRELNHAPEKLKTASMCQVHTKRVTTLFCCSVCRRGMCPYPCFGLYHYKQDYKFDDPKKHGAVVVRKKRKL